MADITNEIVQKVKKRAKKVSAKVADVRSGRPKLESNKLELLVTIVPSAKQEFYTDLLQSNFEVNFQCTARAHGTANAELLGLSLYGFTDQTKTVIFSVIKQERVKDALNMLDEKFNTIKRGKGIAFAVPFTSVIGVATFGFLSNNLKTVKEDKQ